jgi:hypothetical protein
VFPGSRLGMSHRLSALSQKSGEGTTHPLSENHTKGSISGDIEESLEFNSAYNCVAEPNSAQFLALMTNMRNDFRFSAM